MNKINVRKKGDRKSIHGYEGRKMCNERAPFNLCVKVGSMVLLV